MPYFSLKTRWCKWYPPYFWIHHTAMNGLHGVNINEWDCRGSHCRSWIIISTLCFRDMMYWSNGTSFSGVSHEDVSGVRNHGCSIDQWLYINFYRDDHSGMIHWNRFCRGVLRTVCRGNNFMAINQWWFCRDVRNQKLWDLQGSPEHSLQM